jgi:hypothetical protein
MNTSDREKLFFQKIQENRGRYFVEYQPMTDDDFACVNLVFLKRPMLAEARASMEEEAKAWLARYRAPVMVMAFDLEEM